MSDVFEVILRHSIAGTSFSSWSPISAVQNEMHKQSRRLLLAIGVSSDDTERRAETPRLLN